MKKFKQHTLEEYLYILSKNEPAPGGGSAAALTGALGAALISMVANYSKGKGKAPAVEKKIRVTLSKSESIRKELLKMVDLDAQAYLGVVKARKGTPAQKKKAAEKARAVPFQICQLCYEALDLTRFLVEKGNRYLISDVEVAVELLFAAYKSAMINVKINQ